MQWKPFKHGGNEYDLSHLHPCTLTYEQPATSSTPPRTYQVDIIFGLHCFTRGRKGKEITERALLCSDDRETRVFDFVRYGLSKQLPAIISGLGQRKCYHTGKGNFFSIEILRGDEKAIEYDIFFVASRSSKKGRINLYVQSAYVRDAEHASSRPIAKPIGFCIILFNTLNNRPIKMPR